MKKLNLIIIVILLITLIFATLGCTSKNEKNNIEEIIISDWTANDLYDEENFMSMFDEYSHFHVSDVKKEQDCFVATCQVTSPNILENLKEYQNHVNEDFDENEINSKIKDLISSSELKTSEQIVKVFKIDNEYIVEYTDGFVDAMYGYSYLYCCEQLNNMMKNIFE